jgi:beta-aspartyl-peptidase (threonine type)
MTSVPVTFVFDDAIGVMARCATDRRMLTRWFVPTFALALAAWAFPARAQETPMNDGRWSIAIHGGAGTMDRATMSDAQRAEYEAALGTALDAGSAVLAAGGSALDAVEAAVVVMEDDPHFNAGRGAVFTYNGTNELDASIMDGVPAGLGR